jgi:hypothetical protein
LASLVGKSHSKIFRLSSIIASGSDSYLNEFSFRWDLRKVSDGERTVEAIKASEGKRLMYRVPVGN